MTHSAEDHQGILTTFPKAYWYLSLKIKKCQAQHQPPPNQLSTQPSIKSDNTRLRNAEHVLYFGSLDSSNADFSSEANHGLWCASGANARAVVLPTCCGWATSWTTYSRQLKALEEHLRRIPRISWWERRTKISFLEEANMSRITTTVMQHMSLQTNPVLPAEGKPTSPGGRKKRYNQQPGAHCSRQALTERICAGLHLHHPPPLFLAHTAANEFGSSIGTPHPSEDRSMDDPTEDSLIPFEWWTDSHDIFNIPVKPHSDTNLCYSAATNRRSFLQDPEWITDSFCL